MRGALHKLDRVDVTALNELAVTDLKSVGRILSHVERIDLESLGTNATALLTEVRSSNAKLQLFLNHTEDLLANSRS